ncbi:zf-HC2 domain-containing protein [Sphingobium sp. Sx8-8]|uniref:anti-sigma factor n=1 Tax=Sphingobium sp. Sx8-8 TaxID=2933617 RepID=UPI001F56266C|nr:zf-HC2 domain-containing protein [Sphingobium sp. Sx8-8]
MADIIFLRDDPHRSTQMLLPWYVNGQLDASDAAAVEAHLCQCDACRAALDEEARLKKEIAALPVHADLGWEKLQRRLAPDLMDLQDDVRRPEKQPRFHQAWRNMARPAVLGAFAGAQIMLLAVAVLAFRPMADRAEYRSLGAPAARPGGNAIVMFRPDAVEQDMRLALDHAGARIVEGPTAAGAYVLNISPDRRDAALRDLQERSFILLAQPIEPDPPR